MAYIFMACHAVGGAETSSNCQKRLKLEIFQAGHVEYDIINHFAAFC